MKLAIFTEPCNFDVAEKDIYTYIHGIYLHRGSILKERFSDGGPCTSIS